MTEEHRSFDHSRDEFPEAASGHFEPPSTVDIPTGQVSGLTGASAASLILGGLALILVLANKTPFLCWLLASIGIITGLRIFLPRVTTLDKILIAIGVLASVVTIVVLLTRIAA